MLVRGGFFLVVGLLACAFFGVLAVGMLRGKVQVEVQSYGPVDEDEDDDDDEPWRRSLRDDD